MIGHIIMYFLDFTSTKLGLWSVFPMDIPHDKSLHARYKQFLLFPQCFKRSCIKDM